MPVLKPSESPVFAIPGVTFTGLASPSRGSRETSVWRVRLDPRTPGTPHRLTREEIFVVLSGNARATVDGAAHDLTPGCTLIVPAGVEFSLENTAPAAFEAIALMPVGGAASIGGDEPFTPPWAA